MAEWSNALAWKAGKGATPSRVRIKLVLQVHGLIKICDPAIKYCSQPTEDYKRTNGGRI